MVLFYFILPLFALFCLWLGFRILEKAGFNGWWTLVLLVPVLNIIMIWYFAFNPWPNLPKQIEHEIS